MTKKIISCSIIALFFIITPVVALTNAFTKGAITGKLYRVDNVYEEIFNMVNSEKNGTPTALTASRDDAYVDYDLGAFVNVYVPISDKHTASLSFDRNELHIWLREKNSEDHKRALYVYNYQTNTLYGDQDESYLIENFTLFYYSWVGDDGKFSAENSGEYTFVFTEYPLSHK